MAQEACNELDLRASQADAAVAALEADLAAERERLGAEMAQVSY